MKHHWNSRSRGLALFLALVMCFGLLQATVFATGEDDSVGPPPETAGASEAAPVNGMDAVEQVTLTYDVNCTDYNGTEPTPETGNKGDNITIRNLEGTRDGYDFLGWNVDKAATEADWALGDEVRVIEDTTLYAVWEPRANGVSTLPEAPKKGNIAYLNDGTQDLEFVYIQCQDTGDKNSHSAPARLFYDGKTTIVPGEIVENTGDNFSFSSQNYPYQCTVKLDGNVYLDLWNGAYKGQFGSHKLYSEPAEITFYYSLAAQKWVCNWSNFTPVTIPEAGNVCAWRVPICKDESDNDESNNENTTTYQVEWYRSEDNSTMDRPKTRTGEVGVVVAAGCWPMLIPSRAFAWD